MGPIAARHARTVLEHVERILAIELIAGAEALDQRIALLEGDPLRHGDALHHRVAPGAGVAVARERVRALVAPLRGDREPGPDLAAITRLVHEGGLVDLVPEAGR
jgi:histidine ammonia-lyase